MIRRNSSKASNRHPLGRSKSMSCVPREAVDDLLTIEPRNAHRDAHIAATISYEKAQAGAAIDEMYYQRLSNDLQRRISSKKDTSAPNISKDNLTQARSGTVMLQRRQSVRFAGPSARQPRQLVSSTDASSTILQTRASQADNRAFEGRKWRSEGSNQPTSSDRLSQGYNHSRPVALQSISKPISCTSSITLGGRRLRKSRSMFAPFQTTAQETSRDSFDRLEEWLMPYSHDVSDRRSEETQRKVKAHLRAPKSMSFLRPNIPNASSSHASVRNDMNGLAGQPLYGGLSLGDRSLKSHPSMLFLPKNKKRTGLRGSYPNSSNNTDPLSSAFSTAYSPLSKSSGFRNVASKASASLKKKFKGIFKRKKESEGIRDQSFTLGSDHGSLAQTDISAHEEASLSRVRSHVPSLHSVPSVRCPHSRRGSLESADDDIQPTEGERSRVTSWTNSSTNASQITIGDWEYQRLSVINESGNLAARTDNHQRQQTTTALSASANNQRVYSALVKRLDEMNQQQSRKKQQAELSIRENTDQNNSLSRSSAPKGLNWPPSTIRYVQDDDNDDDGVFKDDTAPEPTHFRIPESQNSGQVAEAPSLCSPSESPSEQRSIRRQTPTRSSAFFGSPSNHLFRTQSPYRKTLRQNMKSQQENDACQAGTRYLSSLSTLILPVRMPSPSNSDRISPCASVESIYSCQTEPLEADHVASDSIIEHLPKNAQISCEQQAQHEGPKSLIPATPTRRREVSAASSVEWKRWLSANVSKLETPPSNVTARRQPLVKPMSTKTRHVREDAEIDSPVAEGQISQTDSPDVTYDEEKQMHVVHEWQTPLNPIDPNEVSARRRSSVMNENLHPNTLSNKSAFSKQGSQIAPLRIGLRAAASLPNVKSSRQMWSDKPRRAPLTNSISQSGSFTSPGMELTGSNIMSRRIHDTTPMQYSPELTDAVEKQFGRADFTLAAQNSGLTDEKTLDWQNSNNSWNENQDLNAQAKGSRRMVDLFLNSRQKRHDNHQSGETLTNVQPAFL